MQSTIMMISAYTKYCTFISDPTYLLEARVSRVRWQYCAAIGNNLTPLISNCPDNGVQRVFESLKCRPLPALFVCIPCLGWWYSWLMWFEPFEFLRPLKINVPGSFVSCRIYFDWPISVDQGFRPGALIITNTQHQSLLKSLRRFSIWL